MDYETRATSRKELRLLATVFRGLFALPVTGPIDPLMLLDKMPDVFGNATYEIVDRSEMPLNVPAYCIRTENGDFVIRIADFVFNGAYSKNSGGYRTHILHEIIHVFAYKIGFVPIMSRSFKNKSIPPCRSLEWIVKALTGEVLMPYDETVGMGINELVETYGVSCAAAKIRQSY